MKRYWNIVHIIFHSGTSHHIHFNFSGWSIENVKGYYLLYQADDDESCGWTVTVLNPLNYNLYFD